MFKTAEVVLATAVATSGTFTCAYPTDTSAGDYAGYGHTMFANGLQVLFTQDAGQMSVSFGATEITVTYRGSTSLPAGKRITLQFNMRGANDGRALDYLTGMKRMSFLTPVRIDFGAPDILDADGVAASQTVTGAGTAFVLNGALVASGVAIMDVPRNIVAAWTNTAVLTITGKDEYGNTVVETSASGTSHTGTKAFKKVTSVTTSATVTSATVGTGDVLGLPVYVDRLSNIIAELKDGVLLPTVGGKVVYLQGLALEAAVDGATGLNFVSPVAGKIRKVSAISQTGTTTGGAITVEINTVAINGLSVVVADSSSEGDVDTDTPTKDHATTVVAVGDRIEVQFASAFSGATDLMIVIEIEATYALDGTFVAGVQTLPTGTTGDVRGTYDPSSACDGSLAFSLVALVPDPTYKGVDQFDG